MWQVWFCKKRLNLLKALRGQSWGAHPSTLIYTYKTYVRPLLEYGSILFAHSDQHLLKKIKSVECQAIKIAYGLPPWTTEHWCYESVSFDNILTRIKSLGRQFIDKNREDSLIKPLISEAKPSMNGNHSPIYKILNWQKWSNKTTLKWFKLNLKSYFSCIFVHSSYVLFYVTFLS